MIMHRCNQQTNCSILASTNVFGDPCPGTLKYLEAHYQCVPGMLLLLYYIVFSYYTQYANLIQRVNRLFFLLLPSVGEEINE